MEVYLIPETINAFKQTGIETAKRPPFRSRSSHQVEIGEGSDRRNAILEITVERKGLLFRRRVDQVAVILYDGKPVDNDPINNIKFFPYVEVYLLYSIDSGEPKMLTTQGLATRKIGEPGHPHLPIHRFHQPATEGQVQDAILQMGEATKDNRLWHYNGELLTNAEINEKRKNS